MTTLWAAFTIGLLGSLHCVGMCGPIALALPAAGLADRLQRVWAVMLYNAGRIITYMLLGLVIGLAGKGFFLAGLQSWLSIGAGVLLLVVVLGAVSVEQRLLQWPWLSRAYMRLRGALGRQLSRHGMAAHFYTGILNGLLPCGLVYLAILGAVNTGSVAGGALYMAGFGLGTVPLMAATAFAGKAIQGQWRTRLYRVVPFFMAAMAVWLIMRGLHFDLPTDFRFWQEARDIPMCH